MTKSNGKVRLIVKLILILIGLGVAAYLGLVGMVCWKEAHVRTAKDMDYEAIIVLGCQVKKDGTPNVQLQWRLDAAYDAWQAKKCTIVVTGGQGADEPAPEGQVMRTYLIGRGVPETDILCDDRSTDTRENIEEAAKLLGEKGQKRVLIVTSDYHLPRAIAIAEDQGLTAGGIASETLGGVYWFKNHFREALAWCKYWAEKYLGLDL